MTRGLIVGGRVITGTDLVHRHERAWWTWDDPRDRPDLRLRRGRDVTCLVGHWTAGPIREGEDAAVQTVSAMRLRMRPDGSPMSVSCHLVIGWDGMIWQVADLATATIHAGSQLIPQTVGVETCWPGTAEQAGAIAGTLARRRKPVHAGYQAATETRVVRGRRVRCLPPSAALLAGWVALAELLAALPASTGVIIPRQVSATTGRAAWRGATEHQHAPRTTKIDAAGYLLDALTEAGWAA